MGASDLIVKFVIRVTSISWVSQK